MDSVSGCGVWLTTDKDHQQRLVLMHQASLCEFQKGLKFDTEEKWWWLKHRICFVKIEIEIISKSTCFNLKIS